MAAKTMKTGKKASETASADTIIDAKLEQNLSQKVKDLVAIYGVGFAIFMSVLAIFVAGLPYLQPYFSASEEKPWVQDLDKISAQLENISARSDAHKAEIEAIQQTIAQDGSDIDKQLAEIAAQLAQADSRIEEAHQQLENLLAQPAQQSSRTTQDGLERQAPKAEDAADKTPQTQTGQSLPKALSQADNAPENQAGWFDWVSGPARSVIGGATGFFGSLIQISPSDEAKQ